MGVPEEKALETSRPRFRPFIEKLALETDEMSGDTLVVSHGCLLMNMLPRVVSNIDPDFARANPLGNCDVIVASCQGGNLRCVEWCGLTLENT